LSSSASFIGEPYPDRLPARAATQNCSQNRCHCARDVEQRPIGGLSPDEQLPRSTSDAFGSSAVVAEEARTRGFATPAFAERAFSIIGSNYRAGTSAVKHAPGSGGKNAPANRIDYRVPKDAING
jgi:hypothetical protein